MSLVELSLVELIRGNPPERDYPLDYWGRGKNLTIGKLRLTS